METLKITAEEYSKKNRKAADRLALAVFRAGFPETFDVEVTSAHGKAAVKFAIDEKRINDAKGYHQAIFKYELAKGSDAQLEKLAKAAQDEDGMGDLDGLTYVDSIEVVAEFTNKFDKVWGSLG